MLAELVYGESGESLADLGYYVPDVHTRPRAHEVVPAAWHIIKSHFANNPCQLEGASYSRVVYIVRDPRDVVLSYHRYLARLGRYGHGFDRFVVDWVNGRIWPCSWNEHVSSWTAPAVQDPRFNLHVLRYEDLLANTFDRLSEVAGFLGLGVTEGDVGRAVASGSVWRMRVREQMGMRELERADRQYFIGPATCGRWRQALSPSQISLIEGCAARAMEQHGYL
jgi:hypothetical protein